MASAHATPQVTITVLDPYMQSRVELHLDPSKPLSDICAHLHQHHALAPEPQFQRLVHGGRIVGDLSTPLSSLRGCSSVRALQRLVPAHTWPLAPVARTTP